MENKSVSFILCYARSGGTFLNKFLNNFDDLVVLSEAHPIHNEKGGIHSVKEQMKRWHGVDIKADNYIDEIIETKKWCDKNNKHLIIRDWSYIDFAKSHLNQYSPVKKSTNLEILERNFNVNKIAYVRDAIDVFLSTDHKLNVFSKDYLDFVKYIYEQEIHVFKYEDFCINSDEVIEKICSHFNISVDLKSNSKKIDSNKVIGDLNLSRGNRSSTIKVLPRRYLFPYLIKKIDTNKCLIEANELLNYPLKYKSKLLESFSEYLKFKIIKCLLFVKKVRGKIL